MPAYQLQIKQVVDYPRCRIYRQFVHRLMADRSIRTSGGSGLFYFTVLCSYANFRTSYRRIDGISYTIYPGEWVCTLKEVSQWFRTRFQCQALTVLEQLQKQHFITFHTLDRGNVIRYKICDWARHNTVLEYNAPCQKDVRSKFEIEYGTSIEEFLDSIYLAGADLNGSDIEHHAKCIERSHKMLKLLDSAVELLRTRHKNGEAYYWLLYYSFLSPQQLKNVEEIIENLRPHIRDISFRTYYRRRREAIDALSSVLWGYTSKDSLDMLEQFFPAPKPDEKAKGK